MSTYKFQLGQRVSTPLGKGEIGAIPFNYEVNKYGVWLDKQFFPFPEITQPEHFLVIHESKITAL